jgi:hypothetical protein
MSERIERRTLVLRMEVNSDEPTERLERRSRS